MKKFYLREVITQNEKIRDHYMLKSKLDIFEGTEEDREKDSDYLIKEEGAERVRYFKLDGQATLYFSK